MNLFKKLFCSHKWESHTSRAYKIIRRVPLNLNAEITTDEYTIEVLICKECGKIKKIEY